MDKIPTKDRILDSALNLFSEKGYDGVGVDLIAEKAGLKGPSIYKHFKGKEEILDALIDKVEDYYRTNFGSEINPGKIPSSMEELIEISLKRIRFTMQDETIIKTRKILAMEQFRSKRISELATKHSIDGIQGLYSKIFLCMMDNGVIRKGDPTLLSMAFAAPITLLVQMCDREPDRRQEAMELITEYLNHFVSAYSA